MKRYFVLFSILFCGCSSLTEPKLDINEIARAYYGQQRTYEVVKLTNVNELTLKGDKMKICVSGMLDPLSIINKNKGIFETLVEKAPTAILTGMAIGAMKDIATSPNVIYGPEPLIVEQPAPIIVK